MTEALTGTRGSTTRAFCLGLALVLAGIGVATARVEPRWSAEFSLGAPIKRVRTPLAAER